MLLEICAYNIQSCIVAEKAGASRIELCADPTYGGTTPSYGLIQYALSNISIPVFPMIRPRGGNFIYDADELEIMKKDILACKDLGCIGIATGIQLPNGNIDTENMKRLVGLAYPMQVTCHKVFDATPDAHRSLKDVIDSGCSRILTSGLRKAAIEGASVIAHLINEAAGRIVIMPGGSVRSTNIAQLVKETGAREFHSSGLTSKEATFIANEEEVKLIVQQLPR